MENIQNNLILHNQDISTPNTLFPELSLNLYRVNEVHRIAGAVGVCENVGPHIEFELLSFCSYVVSSIIIMQTRLRLETLIILASYSYDIAVISLIPDD